MFSFCMFSISCARNEAESATPLEGHLLCARTRSKLLPHSPEPAPKKSALFMQRICGYL